jgi:hypothetical protein
MESKEKEGDRWLRLGDLAPHEVIVVRCPCQRRVSQGVFAAAASGAVGFSRLRFAVPFAVLAL